MDRISQHRVQTNWKSDTGTANTHYDRTHTATVDGKPEMVLTTANLLKGDSSKLNPEDLLVASVSSCHMLTYLYLCSVEGVTVTEYTDHATGTLTETGPDLAYISEVQLNPIVSIADENMMEKAIQLHEKAHSYCIIANSVKFPITNNPICKVKRDL